MNLRWQNLAIVACWASACVPARGGAPAAEPLGTWSIASQDIRVWISDEPFGFSVLNAAGQTVLSTSRGAAGDGRAPVAWTTGQVNYETQLSPGYIRATANLQPYTAPTDVEEIELAADQAKIVLSSGDAKPPVHVTLSTRPGALRVSAELESGLPRAWSAGFSASAGEGYLGFGERFNALNQHGKIVFNWAEEGGVGLGEQVLAGWNNPWPNGELMTYYPVPFFVSTLGYGFWLDTSYRSEFDLQQTRPGSWRVSHFGPRLDYEVYVPSSSDPRPWPYHVVDRFTEVTGRPMLPPKWAFGPRRRISRRSLRRDVPEIQAMRDADLPLTAIDDAMHFFPHAAHQGRQWELSEWNAEARRLGYRVNGYYNSFVSRSARAFAPMLPDAVQRGYFLRRPDGSLPNLWIVTGGRMVHSNLVDFTHPEAKAWYQQTFDWAMRLGYSGWMYDFGEYVPPDVIAHDGTSGEALHNLYPVQYARALHEAMEASPLAGDWLAFMRSGYTGSSAYVPMVWAGDPAASFEDSDGLPSVVRGGLNLSISGAPFWGSDIGGYHCVADGVKAADEELLVRWIQQAALTPNMQDQDACVGANRRSKASIWNSVLARKVWRKYARLHTRLFPYVYTWANQAAQHGEPLMRPLFFEHPDRPELAAIDDAYYYGPAFVVAPVVRRGERRRSVVLPDELYLDWNRRRLVTGGQQELPAPLSDLPLLLRAGRLVVLLDRSIDTLAPETNEEVVGPADVADVYDAVALMSSDERQAQLGLYDGSRLLALYSPRRFAATFAELLRGQGPGDLLKKVTHVKHLRTCDRCYAVERRSDKLLRVRINATGDVNVPGLTLQSTSERRIRWDLYLTVSKAPKRAAPPTTALSETNSYSP